MAALLTVVGAVLLGIDRARRRRTVPVIVDRRDDHPPT